MREYSLFMKFVAFVFVIVFINACSQNPQEDDSSQQKVQIIDCNATTPKTYTTIEDGDLLVKDSVDTTVEIVHDSLDNKEVCVLTGSAHLLR
jgi:hypothetical protein